MAVKPLYIDLFKHIFLGMVLRKTFDKQHLNGMVTIYSNIKLNNVIIVMSKPIELILKKD